MTALIRTEEIHKTYLAGQVEVPVLHGVSIAIGKGEFVALRGASGSGKTTLMNILGLLDRPSSGTYFLDGTDVSQISANERAALRSEKIGFVFQNFSLLPRGTARDNVVMPLLYRPDRRGREQDWADELLRRVGLAERSSYYPSQLSGGQQQRVAVARALVNRPLLLLADEPTGNLDSATSDEILTLFRELHRERNMSIVIVTHDAQIAAHAEREILIKDGMVVGGRA